MVIKSYEKPKNESNKSYTYNVLKENIIELYLKPGDKINEVEMSKELNVSRTPIRETFTKLEAEKLITIRPKKGTYVSLIDYELAKAGIFMRITAEKEILKLSCNNFSKEELIKLENILEIQKSILTEKSSIADFSILDREFHKTIFKGCNKESVWTSLEELNIHFSRLKHLRIHDDLDLNKILEEHSRILVIIKTSDITSAENIVSEHLNNLKESLDIYYKKYPHYFK